MFFLGKMKGHLSWCQDHAGAQGKQLRGWCVLASGSKGGLRKQGTAVIRCVPIPPVPLSLNTLSLSFSLPPGLLQALPPSPCVFPMP